MDWTWNEHGKRVRICTCEDTKKKKVSHWDIVMDDENQAIKRWRLKTQGKLERELALYKQQIRDANYQDCCRK